MLIKDDKDLSDILVSTGIFTEEQLQQSLVDRQINNKSLLDWIIENNILTPDQLNETIAQYLGFEYVKLSELKLNQETIKRIDPSTAQQYMVFPLGEENGIFKIAMADPTNLKSLDDISVILNMPVEGVLCDDAELQEFINQNYGASEESLEEMFAGTDELEVLKEEDNMDPNKAEKEANDAPIIKYVNQVLIKALKDRASDIHFEPFEKECRLRYRIDGECKQEPSPPKRLQGAILSRLKIMSGMDISERRIPQDGRIKMKMMGKEIDFRVNSLPCIHGESVVMRLLDKASVSLGLEQVGFIGENKRQFDDIIRKPNGILLVTGPTGSGKTTTLYSALNDINKPDRKLMTIENPVEYMLEGINQVQVQHDIHFDFALGLRAMLRQAPDVIMVGEIRDFETAEIAIRAALTGHLVFSTLHTNDAPSSITRLIDMGINPFLVASSIQAIMAQRLVRTICSKCKVVDEKVSVEALKEMQFPEDEISKTTFYKGEGCENCNFTGYRGRSGVFELMILNQALKDLVLDNVPSLVLRKAALKMGMKSLRQDGFVKVKLGITTPVEVARNTSAEKE
ncbi:Flp pilus assembly complex ATPase component TadA [Candidatus Dependentiae bacterium]|nr:Flp pilus assembly complex ATPase component TadA [Candidatus Dependentiae bacterium]